MKQYLDTYKNELLNQVIPFWQGHSIDKKHGGYFTCLNQRGEVYDTDKFVWLQARQVWLFATLYNKVDSNPEWLTTARIGADFLRKNGRDATGNFYFSLDRTGKPLVQPYNVFSDCFAAMAFSAFHKIDSQQGYAQLAVNTFDNILSRRSNPKGKYNKAYPGTRNLKSFALPMILSNLTLEMESLLDKNLVQNLASGVIHEVMEVFLDRNSGLVLENVLEDGSFSDSFEGRLTSPGHALEAMWFMLDLSNRFGDKDLEKRAIEAGLRTLEYGWDTKYGGIFYFMDCKGHPPDKLEWNQKLWWVHLECLVFLAKAFQVTGDAVFSDWFEKVHDYTWNHFRDPDFPEWFGYLDRYGKVQLSLKGGNGKVVFTCRGVFCRYGKQ